MKTKLRRISFIMIIVLFFVTISAYINVTKETFYASERQMDKQAVDFKSDEEMVELALEYFPEYSEKINHPASVESVLANQTRSNDYLMVNETKKISETEQITYQEYASGRANIMFTIDENITLTQNGSGRQMYRSLNIQVYSLFLHGSMYIVGFAYTIYYDGYDLINDLGDTRASYLPVNLVNYKMNENSSGPATVVYSAVFEYPEGSFLGGLTVPCGLEITVGDNEYSAVAY